ncbi:MAG: oxidoreductase [Bacteroidetes bacterium MedPE-SWsnd-G2]|nr:MAG: oxidoreductase [Bacteroidetes bacterium MedPE-SWsnd-G2]
MKKLFLLFFVLLCFNCSNQKPVIVPVSAIEIVEVYQDSTLSVRAIEILDDGNLAFSGNKSRYGIYNTKKDLISIGNLNTPDSLMTEFRAVGHTAEDFFTLSVANPALLYKTGDSGHMELVYKEEHENVFYDAMNFWNDKEGIAVGDPIDGCMSVIITRDGGNSWHKLDCDKLPNANKGEAAFAASNTNISIYKNHTWIATGGESSRILYSDDKGLSWQVFETPIIQGKPTTGIYSIDFYDAKNGFAIGGDYTAADATINNKIVTTDGGITWQTVANGKSLGYRSCVQYIPNGNAKELLAVGFKGIDYSSDGGQTWKNLSQEGFYTVRFVNDSTAFAAGSKRISKLNFRR